MRAVNPCGEGWTQAGNGDCLTVVAGDVSGTGAAAVCTSVGGQLVSILDDSTNEDVADLCDDAVGDKAYCWIGLRDDDGDGAYMWLGA